jgi:hypothetical protein
VIDYKDIDTASDTDNLRAKLLYVAVSRGKEGVVDISRHFGNRPYHAGISNDAARDLTSFISSMYHRKKMPVVLLIDNMPPVRQADGMILHSIADPLLPDVLSGARVAYYIVRPAGPTDLATQVMAANTFSVRPISLKWCQFVSCMWGYESTSVQATIIKGIRSNPLADIIVLCDKIRPSSRNIPRLKMYHIHRAPPLIQTDGKVFIYYAVPMNGIISYDAARLMLSRPDIRPALYSTLAEVFKW